ncbi:MAG: gluconate 2-dehydrogenase subunit 3 family protein [Ignavibacteriota bacterium]
MRSALTVSATAAAVIPVEKIQAAPQQASAPAATPLAFFRPEEVAFLSAAVDRLIPPDDEWPGAVDAGVVVYIDRQMAGAWGSAGYMYWHGPFKEGTPSQGYQLPFTPAELFRRAIAGINDYFAAKGTSFQRLSPADQDKYLQTLQANETTAERGAFESLSPISCCSIPWKASSQIPFMAATKTCRMANARISRPPYGDYYELIDQYGIKVNREPVSIGQGSPHHRM